MIWSLTGNQWLDNKFRQIIDFSGELGSCACASSPLESKDIEDIRKCIDAGHLAWFYSNIIAWMPFLVEPYKGEQE